MEIASLRRVGNVTVIIIAGEMAEDRADVVDAHINQAATAGGVTGVHLNAARVTSISQAGYRTLIQARRTATRHGLDFTVGVSHNGPVARFLASTPEWFLGGRARWTGYRQAVQISGGPSARRPTDRWAQ